jgi:hypothetical protein
VASKKKTVTKRFKNDPAKAKQANVLVRKAKRELERLMRRRKARNITEVDMDLHLKEIYAHVQLLQPFKRHYLR